MKTSIYTLTSELHDEKAVGAVTEAFLGSLGIDYTLKGSDYADYGDGSLDLIYVRTGGTEGIFKRLLPELQKKSAQPFYLLTSGKSNSLAASMEILSFLRQTNLRGEIIHGSTDYINHRINILKKVREAHQQLKGCRLGIIGEPSDWLISSHADKDAVRQRLGIELIDIPMSELLETINNVNVNGNGGFEGTGTDINDALPGANRIYMALKSVVERNNLQGFTLRCFDLLTEVRNTGCLALAKLNAEGIVGSCEGDVPAMLSMMITKSLTGLSGFQANPSSINPDTGEMLFAHCTIPLNMVERYEMDTHFESGIGIGIRGYAATGPVTIFKVSGDVSRYFIAEGYLIANQAKADLCRTQQIIRLADKSQTNYFLTNPIGNHHIILPGHNSELINDFLTGTVDELIVKT
ncbi:MAG: hypothetical protein J6Z41_07820 [Prevotella sp.]|nr:hypothetical protein [Prevotella sp.]